MVGLSAKLLKFRNSGFFKYGLPFFVLMIGGSFGLKQFTNLRYQFRRQKTLTTEEANALNKLPKPVSLEQVYEDVQTTTDIENWENKRIPRPYEE